MSTLCTKSFTDLKCAQACCHDLAQACLLLRMLQGSAGVQVHMYMEPQTAVAKWDEGGVIQVSCPDMSHIATELRQRSSAAALVIAFVHHVLPQAACSA